MDNKKISIQSEGKKSFDLAVKLFFIDEYDHGEPTKTVTHYYEDPDKGLVLLWAEDNSHNSVKLPVPLKWQAAADLAWEWLINQSDDSYKDRFDHDGSNGKGFKVYNEAWGRIGNCHYALFAVVPVWAWYGK